MRKRLTLLICISFIGISFCQIKVNGIIYCDSTLTKEKCNAKINLKFGNETEVYKTDKYGKFDFETKLKKFSLEIEMKGFTSVNISEISKDIHFDVIMRKAVSVDDKEYKGVSKVILKN